MHEESYQHLVLPIPEEVRFDHLCIMKINLVTILEWAGGKKRMEIRKQL